VVQGEGRKIPGEQLPPLLSAPEFERDFLTVRRVCKPQSDTLYEHDKIKKLMNRFVAQTFSSSSFTFP